MFLRTVAFFFVTLISVSPSLATKQHASTVVDVGYSVYHGSNNATASMNVFKGIRYAQSPTGPLRWQAPRAPLINRSATIPATEYPAQCPQSLNSVGVFTNVNQSSSSEDCLFLNIWTPSNASGLLPVFLWIHGGGYGAGNGQQDLTPIINTNDNSFVGVTIQYRLGAFGFLSSDEVRRKGVVNAGLLDQYHALQWVQKYIHLFNGDPSRVTIGGESAGAGSVMLQNMAYGGSLGTQLYRNSITASPYLPMQYDYKDWIPTQSYYALAALVGCDPMKPYGGGGSTGLFECLQNTNTSALINASNTVSQEGLYGTWAFLPVTDGTFIQDLPSRQLLRGKVNGVNQLTGNNAEEGPGFTPQDIKTEDALVAWLQETFPLFSNNDIAKILYYYPAGNSSVNPNAPLFATNGTGFPSALNQSSVGTGQQERANLIYGETTFICPSYWLAEAFSDNNLGGKAYKYQFSVPPALHGYDVAGYFDWPGTEPYSYDFDVAFQKMWGNFITKSNPSISNAVANGITTNNSARNPASSWPPYAIYAPEMMNLNTTCGVDRLSAYLPGVNISYCMGPGTYNRISQANAYTWEAGRGVRCDFWRSMGDRVPA